MDLILSAKMGNGAILQLRMDWCNLCRINKYSFSAVCLTNLLQPNPITIYLRKYKSSDIFLRLISRDHVCFCPVCSYVISHNAVSFAQHLSRPQPPFIQYVLFSFVSLMDLFSSVLWPCMFVFDFWILCEAWLRLF